MAFGRKVAVGTALDREELEQLLNLLATRLGEVKTATWEMGKAADKAARVMQDLNKALDRADSQGRRRLTRN